jgi:hypothetical protein
MFGEPAAYGERRMDSNADFLRRERFVNFEVSCGHDVNPQGALPMDFVSPLVSRLGVVAAYVAFAFVGAIVLGVF